MKLRFKLPLFTSIILFVSITTLSVFSIIQFRKEINKNIETYRKEATDEILNHLKDVVNIAYAMIDNSYQLSDPNEIKIRYGINITDIEQNREVRMILMNLMKITLGNLRVLRFGTDGYIWINEFEPPYQVILHPIRPELEGKSWIFYVGKTDKNVYEAFHDTIVAGNGAGRVSYNFYKPGTNEKIPKISWVKLYEPLGWVIGTGVYIDYIDKIVQRKQEQLHEQIQTLILAVSTIGLFFLIISVLVLTFFARSITRPLFLIEEQLYEMAKGKIVEKLKLRRKDEIGMMKKSLDSLIDGLQRYSEFAFEIGKENYDANFEILSKFDVLGNALIEMRNSLKEARRQEKIRMEEERMRQWINEGIARISDIVTLSPDIETITNNVLPKLIDYLKATMGAIFLVETDTHGEEYLELSSAVAYNRKKYSDRHIDVDEGLIGSCFLEQEPIYLTEIPEDYIQIRTGLGKSNPRNIYLVPLKFEKRVYGVLELASFNIFNDYNFQLINEAAKIIAVSLSTKSKYSER